MNRALSFLLAVLLLSCGQAFAEWIFGTHHPLPVAAGARIERAMRRL